MKNLIKYCNEENWNGSLAKVDQTLHALKSEKWQAMHLRPLSQGVQWS